MIQTIPNYHTCSGWKNRQNSLHVKVHFVKVCGNVCVYNVCNVCIESFSCEYHIYIYIYIYIYALYICIYMYIYICMCIYNICVIDR